MVGLNRLRHSLLGLALTAGTVVGAAGPAGAACALPAGYTRAGALTALARGGAPGSQVDTVFVGTATATEAPVPTPPDQQVATVFTPTVFRADVVVTGAAAPTLTVLTAGGTLPGGVSEAVEDTPYFQVGQRYLVVTQRDSQGHLVAWGCGETGPLQPGDVAVLMRSARRPVVYDQALVARLAETGSASMPLTAFAVAAIAFGAVLLLLHPADREPSWRRVGRNRRMARFSAGTRSIEGIRGGRPGQ